MLERRCKLAQIYPSLFALKKATSAQPMRISCKETFFNTSADRMLSNLATKLRGRARRRERLWSRIMFYS